MLSKSPQSFSESSMINARSGDAMYLLQVVGQCCLIGFQSKFEKVGQLIRIAPIWRSHQLGRETIHRELESGETSSSLTRRNLAYRVDSPQIGWFYLAREIS